MFFVYRMRRVKCPRCGVTVERVPWAEGKQRMTTTYRWFLAKWAKRLSWTEVATIFGTSWDSVCRAVELAVEWGRKRRKLSNVRALGVDEIAWRKGHSYLTLVYDIGVCWRSPKNGRKRVCERAWINSARRSAAD